MKKIFQCHETFSFVSNGQKIFSKYFDPFSFELTNEINWLSSILTKGCRSFEMPKIENIYLSEGILHLEYIEDCQNTKEKIIKKLDSLVSIAAELHSIASFKRPFLKYSIFSEYDYFNYLRKYFTKRVNSLTPIYLDSDIAKAILRELKNIKSIDFAVTHRDLRVRHLLWPEETDLPFLVDWEYANISDPIQDIAKIVHEHIAFYKHLDFKKVTHDVVNKYCCLRNIKKSKYLLDKLYVFLFLIQLEDASSLLLRKPRGYQSLIVDKMTIIKNIYEKR